MKVLSDIDVSGKRVFVRADLDVNVANPKSEIRNPKLNPQATRLTNLKPTVDYLLEHGASQIIIAGHIDRPEKPDPELSTKQLLEPLEKILGQKISFKDVILGSEATPESDSGQARMTGESKVVLFENLRFWEGEVVNDLEFARSLAALADVYVNEAFGNCHRNHASMVALPSLLPHAAGFHLQREIEELSSRVLNNPQRPFIAIVGGAKVETKVPVIENLSKIADYVLIGGVLPLEIAQKELKFADNVVIAGHAVDGKDITSESQDQFARIIKSAKTVVWNGPVGRFEEGFEAGTLSVAQAIIESDAYSVVGGGETTQFLALHNLLSKFSFVSSGGGAMLEFLAGRKLPALIALE